MSTNLNGRYSDLVVEGLTEISDEFTGELGHSPSSFELFEILTWSLKSCRSDSLLDIIPATVIGLKPKLKSRKKHLPSPTGKEETGSDVKNLNDNVFVIANDFIGDLLNAMKLNNGQAPTFDELCTTLVEGLHQCAEDLLSDTTPSCVLSVKADVRKQHKFTSKVGDIISIPAKNDEFFIACIVAKNCFGTAYGFFEGTHKLKPALATLHLAVKRHPIYSDDELVASGRWQVIDHNEELLSLFPSEPEIYHTEQILDEEPKIGPYGSGETVSGILRDLTEEEAREIGLFDDNYSQIYLSEDLENYFNSAGV